MEKQGIIFFFKAFMIICVVIFLVSVTALAYKNIFGVANKNADRNIYKQSKSYTEGMAKDLAKYKYEYDTSKEDLEKKAIKDRIINDFGNFDSSKIKESELRNFLKEMRGF